MHRAVFRVMFRNVRVTVEQRQFLMLIRHCMKWRAVDPHCAKRKRKGKKVKEIKDMTSVKNRFIESKGKRKKKKHGNGHRREFQIQDSINDRVLNDHFFLNSHFKCHY